jgi:hypothetical protein
MSSLHPFRPRSVPRPKACPRAHSAGPDFPRPAAREAAESGPVAQTIGALVLLLIWLLVFCIAFWPVWSGVWARLAASALH